MHAANPGLGSTFRVLSSLLALVALLLTATGCGRSLTPADFEQHGTRTYRGRRPSEIAEATRKALTTLGFEVVPGNEASRVKTAPKLLQVTVVGGRASALAMGDALAWSFELEARGSEAVVVRAIPRAYRNGQRLPDSEMNAVYMERAFADLFRELEDNLGTVGEAPEVTKKGTPPAATRGGAP